MGSAQGLVAAYGFDDVVGRQANDTSGNENYGTTYRATAVTIAGGDGQSLRFDGIDDLVTVKDSDSLDLTNGMTIAAWVYPTASMSGWNTVVLKESSSGLAYSLCANSDSGQPNTTLRVGSADQQLSAGSYLRRNTWAHLAATYDGSTQKLYVNGALVGSHPQTGPIGITEGALRIGGNRVWGDEYFAGLIDDVRIYNRALSESEISVVPQEPVSQEPVVDPASACATPCSLWDSAATPRLVTDPDTTAVELGVKLRSTVDGLITGVRFYKSRQNTGTHVGRLWSSTGQLLAQATFTNETASGWQQANFATPVAIKANIVHVASYHTNVGRYSVDEGYFASAYTAGPLRLLANGESGGNGVYRYGAGGFPTQSYRSSNYWLDVLFTTP